MNEAPLNLDDEGRRKWGEVYPILESRGDVDQGTLDALTAYCSAWSQWLAAEAQVKTLGAVVKSAAGFAQENPFLTVARKAQTAMRQWAGELRLTPKARGKDAAAADSQANEELQAAIIAYVGETTASTVRELQKAIKQTNANHGYAGNLDRELAELQKFGIPWESAAIGAGANSVRVSRTLAAMEREGLLQCFNPSGRRTAAVRLTDAGQKVYKDSQG
jgi:P27 family predicted phage terminase small subunit